jgi:N-acetylmuramoyl-L-alanine amidase
VRLRVIQPAAVALVAVLLGVSSAGQTPTGAPYTVITKSGRQSLPVRVVGGEDMVALDDLARLFGLTVREDALAGGLTVTVNGQTIVLSPQQPLASVAGRMISLPAPPVRQGGAWLVPIDFVARALAPVAGQKIDLRKPSRLLLIGDVRMPRVAVRSDQQGTLTRVTVDVSPPTAHTVSQEGSRLQIRFDADALDLAGIAITPGDLLQAVHPGDSPSVLVFDLGPRFASFRAADQPPPTPGSGRIFIDLFAQSAPPPGAPPTATPPTTAPETPPLLDLPAPGGLRTIVIDPGHGGDDAGGKGAGGTLEKNVALAVARRLKAALESRLGVRVLLTRDGDQNVAIDQRAAVANNNTADLFLSLHANASVRPSASGVEVFHVSLDGFTEEAQRTANAPVEPLPVLGGGSRDIEVIPWEMAQARYLDRSTTFAQALQSALREHATMSARAIEEAPLRVLVGANMPAAVVELGFLTNSAEEKQLAGDAYQTALVQGLVEGILRYRDAGAGAGR